MAVRTCQHRLYDVYTRVSTHAELEVQVARRSLPSYTIALNGELFQASTTACLLPLLSQSLKLSYSAILTNILAKGSARALIQGMEFEVIAKCHTTKARVSRMRLAREYSLWLSITLAQHPRYESQMV